MNAWLVCIPVAGAFTGWLLNRLAITLLFFPLNPVRFAGFSFQGIFYQRQHQIAGKLGKLVHEELFSVKDLESKFVNEENLLKLMPGIEVHIDHFMRVKLKEAMPVVAMFVGDKTISQLKEIFMEELQLLFPQIMKNYFILLQEEADLEKFVREKLIHLTPEKIQSTIQPVIHRELRPFQTIGAVTGFITGIVLLLCMLIFI